MFSVQKGLSLRTVSRNGETTIARSELKPSAFSHADRCALQIWIALKATPSSCLPMDQIYSARMRE